MVAKHVGGCFDVKGGLCRWVRYPAARPLPRPSAYRKRRPSPMHTFLFTSQFGNCDV